MFTLTEDNVIAQL